MLDILSFGLLELSVSFVSSGRPQRSSLRVRPNEPVATYLQRQAHCRSLEDVTIARLTPGLSPGGLKHTYLECTGASLIEHVQQGGCPRQRGPMLFVPSQTGRLRFPFFFRVASRSGLSSLCPADLAESGPTIVSCACSGLRPLRSACCSAPAGPSSCLHLLLSFRIPRSASSLSSFGFPDTTVPFPTFLPHAFMLSLRLFLLTTVLATLCTSFFLCCTSALTLTSSDTQMYHHRLHLVQKSLPSSMRGKQSLDLTPATPRAYGNARSQRRSLNFAPCTRTWEKPRRSLNGNTRG
jgi:hypothetical protein